MDQFITFIGNNPVLSLIWVALFLVLVFTTIKARFSPVTEISPQQVTFLMNKEDGVVVDIRDDKEYRQGHILNAQHMAMEKVNSNDFVSLEKFKAKPIIVVCAAGMTAAKAANSMVKAGFTNVSLLKGGMTSWQNAGLPVAKK